MSRSLHMHFHKFRKSAITHNFLAMFGTQIAAYAFPLATIPYLARVLGPVHWGMVAFAQALGLYLSMVVEFGFNLSATRRVARARGNKQELEEIVAGVMGAKVLLAAVSLVITFVLQYLLKSFQQYGVIFWAGALSGIGQGFSMLWYFQGMERMKTPAAMDVLGKGLAAAGIFMFVHNQQDAWRVLGLQCVCYCFVSLLLLWIAYKEVRFIWPSMDSVRCSMRDSAAMFLFRSSVSLYTTANALILGALSTPSAVGFYSGAEKLVKAMLNLLTPLTQALFPRLSRLLTTDRKRAARLTRVSLLVMTAGSLLLCIGTLAAAPLITRIVLGPGYESAIPVMRVLSLLLPAIAVSNVLGLQWMLPLGMDVAYNKIIISAGLLNLLLASLLAGRWQQMGMAWSVVASEYLVTIAVCVLLVRRKTSPFNNPTDFRVRLQEQLNGINV